MSCNCKGPGGGRRRRLRAAPSVRAARAGRRHAPEFEPGDIVIIEPDGGAAADGSFVLARHGDGWLLRQLVRRRRPVVAAGA
jgi:hypothetical protein